MLTRPASRVAIVSAVLAVPVVASAAPKYWTNLTTGSHNLSTAGNWEDNAALSSSADDLRFFIDSSANDLTLLGTYTITNDVASLSLNRLDLDGQSNAGGRSVTIEGLGFTMAAGATLSLQNQANSGGSSFGYTISAPVTFAGGLNITGTPGNPGAITFSNATLANTASSFVHNSNNRISLNNASLDANHSFSGTGTGGINLGGSVTLTGNRVFDVTGSASPTLGGTISDGVNSYSITKTGSGLLNIGAANHSIDGGIVVQGGILGLAAGGGTFTHTSAGVTVQNAATVRIDWGGTPGSPVVATNINYGVGGGNFEFGAPSGNPVTLGYSGQFAGSGVLKLIARNNKDAINFTADNSAYSGKVMLMSDLPGRSSPRSYALFNDTNARFGSALGNKVMVRDGGRVGFTGSTTTTDITNYKYAGRGGITFAGASGVLDAAVSDPFAALPTGAAITLLNRDTLNTDRIPDASDLNFNGHLLSIVGRNASNSPGTEVVDDLRFAGGSVITLDRANSSAGVRLQASSMSLTAGAGNSLLIESTNLLATSGNSDNNLIVTGTKPTLTNGILSPAVQFFTGANSTGDFVTFSGNNLVAATYSSTNLNTAGANDTVNSGAVTLGSDKTVYALRSSGNINLGGFTLTLGSGGLITANNTYSNGTLAFGANAGVIGAYNASSQATISAAISGSGGLTILGASQTLNITNNSNTLTGGIFINGSTVRFSGTASNGNAITVGAMGRLVAGASGGGTDTIGGLSGTGLVSSWMANSGSAANTLNIAPSSGTYTFDGTMLDGNGSPRPLNIQKSGGGTQVLGQSFLGIYSGTTTVSEGVLLLNGTQADGGSWTVASGATVGGSGSTTSDITLAGGATLSPGNSPGTLSTGPMTLNDTTALTYELGTPWAYNGSNIPSPNDLVRVTGNLTLNGQLNVSGLLGFGSGTYTLFTYTGTLIDSGLSVASLPSGFTGSISIDGTNKAVNLVVIPEPASLSLLAMGAIGLVRRRR